METRQPLSIDGEGVGGCAPLTSIGAVEKLVLEHHPKADLTLLRQADTYASSLHQGQVRKSGEPFYHHPLSVAGLLAAYGMDLVTIAAGLLVDSIEDGGITGEELEKRFGQELAYIVEGVSKAGQFKVTNMSKLKAEHYRRVILSTARDLRVLIVCLADCSINMRTLVHLQPEQQIRISREVLDIYAPLANRLGMNRIKTELEQLAFFYLDPETYHYLDQLMEERAAKSEEFFRQTTHSLRQSLEERGITASVSSRIKSHYSIAKKIRSKDRSLEGVYDYFTFRILTESLSDCYRILGILHGQWRHIPGRIKDFIATPKENMYQSIHTTLISEDGTLFEVQIRTEKMHRIAELGIVGHWNFEQGQLPRKLQEKMSGWFRDFSDENKNVHNPEEFLDYIKDQLQIKNIIVFTPRSEVKQLPQGSCPLDFAYLIHTDLGNQAIGALVNGERVSLRTRLNSGDIVEILKDPEQTPVRAWLDFVRTPAASNKIRTWLRKETRRRERTYGKIIFERELHKYRRGPRSVTLEQITPHLEQFGLNKPNDFFRSIVTGAILPEKAVGPFVPDDEIREGASRFRRAWESISGTRRKIQVRGQADPLFRLCNRCNPIIGDPITGRIHKDSGIFVHRQDCRHLRRSENEQRPLVELEWAPPNEFRLFKVSLEIKAVEQPGMLANISQAIAETGTSISLLHAASGGGKTGIVTLEIKISNASQLEKVMTNLNQIEGIVELKRK